MLIINQLNTFIQILIINQLKLLINFATMVNATEERINQITACLRWLSGN